MELWDGYLRDGTPAGRDLVRGEPIPEGLYHLVCEVLVRHRDGEYLLMQRDLRKPNHGGSFETSAGGSAVKGEGRLACAERELYEETGIPAADLTEIARNLSDNTIYYSYLCITDCDKSAVRLQEGETVSYRWLSEEAFTAFINSGAAIPSQRERLRPYFEKLGYITASK